MSQLTRAVRRILGTNPEKRTPRSQIEQTKAAGIAFQGYEPPYRLHLACGKVRLPDWINVDQDAWDTVDVRWDLRLPLPIADETAEFVYHEHFLEHLTVKEGLALLRECRRLLMPGGVLRVAMPDLAECVRQYWQNDWRQPWMQKYGYEWIQTRAECLNIAFREWQHQWLYDREELHRRLKEAGYTTVRDCERLKSDVPELCGLETRDETLLVCEAVK